MAVTVTTKFYEEDSPAWHDLSKVVFTSPNIDSPNTAGTRSHILPGRGDLALWYEDTSNMYEIEPLQGAFDTSFYYYYFTVTSGIDLDSNPTSAFITAGNFPEFMRIITEASVTETPLGYVPENQNIVAETMGEGYLSKIDSPLANIYLETVKVDTPTETMLTYCSHRFETVVKKDGYEMMGWRVGTIPKVGGGVEECHIDFKFNKPTRITYITMGSSCMYNRFYTWSCDPNPPYPDYELTSTTQGEKTYYFIGNFKIQAKIDTPTASWVDLYTGSFGSGLIAENATVGEVIMTDNDEYYTYYRILILDNESFEPLTAYSTWGTEYFSLSNLKFYSYQYEYTEIEEEEDWDHGYLVLSSFESDTTRREVHVIDAMSVGGDTINTDYNTDTNVEGFINVSTCVADYELTTKYMVDVDEVGVASVSYSTHATGNSVSPVISGTTGPNGATGTTMVSQDFGVLANGSMDVTGEIKIENGYIYSNLSGQQTDRSYSNIEFDVITDITYTTVVSGIISAGAVGNIAVTGHTNRYEDRTSTSRGNFYKVSIADTVGTGIIPVGSTLYSWSSGVDQLSDIDFSTSDSIIFELTMGEAYDCRLTAWDDVTHSTTVNYLIAGDYVRVSALAFRSKGNVLEPEASILPSPVTYIASPIYNRIFKGNVVYEGVNYYYGDFDLSYRTEPDMIGDFLIFKPILYNIDDIVPYGIHDHVIVLHYTYT